MDDVFTKQVAAVFTMQSFMRYASRRATCYSSQQLVSICAATSELTCSQQQSTHAAIKRPFEAAAVWGRVA